MIGSQVLGPAAAAGLSAECIKERGQDMIEKGIQYQKAWDNYLSVENGLVETEKENIQALVDDMQQIQAETTYARQVHKKAQKQIQESGIMGITVIFFLLLLKTFGLLGPLFTMLAYPFTYIYKMLV